jgi:membrane associated rhomboid family serine protease
MGMQDRDWIRTPSGSNRSSMGAGPNGAGAMAQLRMLSATTWLIIACVAVYLVDGLTRPVGAALENPNAWTLVAINQTEAAKTATNKRIIPPFNEPPSLARQLGPHDFQAQRKIMVDGKEEGSIAYNNMPLMKRWGFFSTATALVGFNAQGQMQGVEFWRFISFQFLHADMVHLFMNMFGLWIFGPLVERALGAKRFLAFYLLCGIFGALCYLLLNATGNALSFFGIYDVPGLLFNDTHVPLVGASAGVFGVLLAGAYLAPSATVLLFFIIPMRLVTLAYGLVIVSVLTLLFRNTSPLSNAGGEAAHLGGALAGFYFIRRPHHLHGFFDLLGRIDPTSRSSKARRATSKSGRALDDAEIDRILAKIHAKGLQSLSAREKKILRESSRR